MSDGVMWELETALGLIRALNPPAQEVGFSVALGGSVLYEGSSKKDLDLIVLPLNGECYDINKFRDLLKSSGWGRRFTAAEVKRQWAKKGSSDTKNVEIWLTPSRKRVDIFYLS